MNIVRSLLILAVTWCSTSVTAASDLSVSVDYRHGPVHVHYSLPCSYGSTSTLMSSEGADIAWKLDVTPKNMGNGLVSVTTVVRENGQDVSRSDIINKLGEAATLISRDPEGNEIKLVIRPH